LIKVLKRIMFSRLKMAKKLDRIGIVFSGHFGEKSKCALEPQEA